MAEFKAQIIDEIDINHPWNHTMKSYKTNRIELKTVSYRSYPDFFDTAIRALYYKFEDMNKSAIIAALSEIGESILRTDNGALCYLKHRQNIEFSDLEDTDALIKFTNSMPDYHFIYETILSKPRNLYAAEPVIWSISQIADQLKLSKSSTHFIAVLLAINEYAKRNNLLKPNMAKKVRLEVTNFNQYLIRKMAHDFINLRNFEFDYKNNIIKLGDFNENQKINLVNFSMHSE